MSRVSGPLREQRDGAAAGAGARAATNHDQRGIQRAMRSIAMRACERASMLQGEAEPWQR